MSAILTRLWFWYGRKHGLLDVRKDVTLLSGDVSHRLKGVVFRGVIKPGDVTICVSGDRWPVAWNRLLTDAEIKELRLLGGAA